MDRNKVSNLHCHLLVACMTFGASVGTLLSLCGPSAAGMIDGPLS